MWGVAGVLIIVAAIALYSVLSKKPQMISAPMVTTRPMPGDAYINQTVNAYIAAVISGDEGRITRLRDTVIDADAVRAETLGRFASIPVKYLKVRSVHEECAYSGNGAAAPATHWSAVATIESKRGGKVETLDAQLRGTYASAGTVDSSEAVASP
jgi:hypothetical protein